jgi:hypothetical protein
MGINGDVINIGALKHGVFLLSLAASPQDYLPSREIALLDHAGCLQWTAMNRPMGTMPSRSQLSYRIKSKPQRQDM